MKITEIKIRELRVPLVHPYVLSKLLGVQYDTSQVVAEVHTDEGIVGWGEGDPWPLFTGDVAPSVMLMLEKVIGPAVIGKDPTNINAIHEAMDAALKGNLIAKSAIDMACYDLLGTPMTVPVPKMLGGKLRDSIRCFWAVGGETPDDVAKAIAEVKEKGYWGCMIKVGTADWKNDAAKTLAAREAVGPDFPINADGNQGWDVETAISYGKAVEKANLLFLEQPVPAHDLVGMAKLRRKIDIPISADESISTIHDAMNLIKAEAADCFSIKPTKHGGIMPTKEICSFAEAHDIKLFFNSMMEEGITQVASLNVAATTRNIMTTTGHSYFSTLRLVADITDFCTWTKDGVTHIPDNPGLGFKINNENLEKYTIDRKSIR